jgi:hypothetical protein
MSTNPDVQFSFWKRRPTFQATNGFLNEALKITVGKFFIVFVDYFKAFGSTSTLR